MRFSIIRLSQIYLSPNFDWNKSLAVNDFDVKDCVFIYYDQVGAGKKFSYCHLQYHHILLITLTLFG